MAAILMTKSVWGSEDNGAAEPPQSTRLMLPFQQACSAAECARLPGKWKWRGSRGLGPIKTQARVSSPTLIILDLSHLSTLCKYTNTLPQTKLRTYKQGTAICTVVEMLLTWCIWQIDSCGFTLNGNRFLRREFMGATGLVYASTGSFYFQTGKAGRKMLHWCICVWPVNIIHTFFSYQQDANSLKITWNWAPDG